MSTVQGGQGNIVTNGLILNLDAANPRSYPQPYNGTTWTDLSGNGNNGTLVNGVAYTGSNGGALVFDGVNDYVDCGNNSSLNSIVTYTVSIWMNLPNVSNDYNPLFCRHNRGTISSDIEIYGGNGGITLVHNRDNGGTFSFSYAYRSPNLPSSNTPQYITITYGSNTFNTYLNGTPRETFSFIPPPRTTSGYVTDIGQFYSNPYFMTGRIHNYQVYNRTLSASEVLQNFNATRARFGV